MAVQDSIVQFAIAAPLVAQADGSPLQMMPVLVLIGIFFYMLILRPERSKQRQHRTLLEGLKKNDRVVTIGGIYGVVNNVQREEDKVTLVVDEASNAKIKVTVGAIARVLSDEAPAATPAKS